MPTLLVETINGRNVFPSIPCEQCDKYPTNHRCLVEVDEDGYAFEGMLVCGMAICAICSSKCGNEGTFRCYEHSLPLKENDVSQLSGKGTAHAAKSRWIERGTPFDRDTTGGGGSKKQHATASKGTTATKGSRDQGLKYSATENLLLSKAWVSASENALTGAYQKVNTFWESVLKAYNVLKDQHDEYQERQEQKSQFRKQNLKHAVQKIGILEAHEIPFSRPIAKGISWSGMNYIPVTYFYYSFTTKTGCIFFASNYSLVIPRPNRKGDCNYGIFTYPT